MLILVAKYNPDDSLCSSLAIGQPICYSGGSLLDLTPQPNDDGTCYSYTVQDGDYCALLAEEYYITTHEIEEYNDQTWAGCNYLSQLWKTPHASCSPQRRLWSSSRRLNSSERLVRHQ